MFAYFKYGKRFAVFVEFSKALGIWPAFKVNTCNGETIIEIPFGQVILTPGARLMREGAGHDDEHDEHNTGVSAAPERASED